LSGKEEEEEEEGKRCDAEDAERTLGGTPLKSIGCISSIPLPPLPPPLLPPAVAANPKTPEEEEEGEGKRRFNSDERFCVGKLG